MTSETHSCSWLPFMAYGSFRNFTRQNHGMAGKHEASGFVNSAVSTYTEADLGRGPRNMKSMQSPLAAIFFMTYFYRARRALVPLPPGSTTVAALFTKLLDCLPLAGTLFPIHDLQYNSQSCWIVCYQQ